MLVSVLCEVVSRLSAFVVASGGVLYADFVFAVVLVANVGDSEGSTVNVLGDVVFIFASGFLFFTTRS